MWLEHVAGGTCVENPSMSVTILSFSKVGEHLLLFDVDEAAHYEGW
jgi:hypothetical protein